MSAGACAAPHAAGNARQVASPLRIALAQLNLLVGDVQGNDARLREAGIRDVLLRVPERELHGLERVVHAVGLVGRKPRERQVLLLTALEG